MEHTVFRKSLPKFNFPHRRIPTEHAVWIQLKIQLTFAHLKVWWPLACRPLPIENENVRAFPSLRCSIFILPLCYDPKSFMKHRREVKSALCSSPSDGGLKHSSSVSLVRLSTGLLVKHFVFPLPPDSLPVSLFNSSVRLDSQPMRHTNIMVRKTFCSNFGAVGRCLKSYFCEVFLKYFPLFPSFLLGFFFYVSLHIYISFPTVTR